MFTGIIENTGKVEQIVEKGTNRSYWISSSLAPELKVDQSLAHNGVCLTVEEVLSGKYSVTAVAETLSRTNMKEWIVGSLVNLERCMQMNGRLDGHIVQGHVDTTAVCTNIIDKSGSWEFTFKIADPSPALMIEKGSVTVNGISLTIFNVTNDSFSVAIIPYTFQHTNIHQVKTGSTVNIEFDMIGKYVQRFMNITRR